MPSVTTVTTVLPLWANLARPARTTAAAFVALAAITVGVAAGSPGNVHAAATSERYTVDAAASRIGFLAVKDGDVPVAGRFPTVAGTLDLDTKAGTIAGRITVDVRSLDTGLAPRDFNIITAFFEATAPTGAEAVLEPKAVRGNLEALRKAGGRADLELDADLTLHGTTVPITVPLAVTRGRDGSLAATTRAPVALRFADFGMTAQAAALKALCGHKELTGLASLSVDLRLQPAN